ncbi:Syntaxin-5 [Trichinella pseudospiralis]|uniref:Syntaxin-5 n=1 Tax=Trichinella pseudospiralis TaxID=6337 RepID=A0A0V1EPT9_TRIPS|nr:Syntaxin-5 [Trichinella pseudospiralis]KRY86901.1 Syntaxin-5 [Trichinella pseudospiralis]
MLSSCVLWGYIMSDSSFARRRRRKSCGADGEILTSCRDTTNQHQHTSLIQTLASPSSTIEKSVAPSTSTSKEYNPQNVYVEMPGRDRSAEFRAIVQSFQLKVMASAQPVQSRQRVVRTELQQFSLLSKQIGHDLSETFLKLEKLTILAKRKSLFDDRPGEVDELTQIIKQDIANLNRQIGVLQQMMQRNQSSSEQNQSQHSKSIVVTFQSKLATISSDFKSVLQLRTQNMKQQKMRRERFSAAEPIPNTLSASASSSRGSVLLNGNVESEYVLEMDEVERRQTQQQLQLINQQDSYLRNRAETMVNIEETIVELGQIFSSLAHMVQEQGEMVQRIDSNVEDAVVQVEAAHIELLKFLRSISRNRWLAIKVFIVLLVFFIFFVVVML